MPYRRTYKKKYTRRRRYGRKTGGWMGIAKKALQTANFVKGLINAEAKDYYKTQTYFSADNNGTIVSLNDGIARGVDDGEFTGDSIKMKTLTIRGNVKINTGVPGGIDIGRLVIFIDKQNNVGSGGGLLENVGSEFAPISPKNDNNYYDSKIVWDRRFEFNTVNNVQYTFTKILKLDTHVKFTNGAATIANNNLKLLWITQQPAAGGLGAQLMFDSKLTYMDN